MRPRRPPIAPEQWRPYAEPVPPLRRYPGLPGVLVNPVLSVLDMGRRARHYAPSRPRTVWQRWIDLSMWLSLLLSPLAVLAMTMLAQRSAIDSRCAAMFWLGDSGQVGGALLGGDKVPTWSVGHPIGVWELRATHRLQGWPLPVIESARTLEFIPTIVIDRQFTADQIRPLFDRLAQRDPALPTAGGVVRMLPWNFVADSLLLWPPLFASLALLVAAARFGATFARQRAAARASEQTATGRCHRCGYDLRGSLLSTKCPECGANSDR